MAENENIAHELTDEQTAQAVGGWDGDWANWEPEVGILCFQCRTGTLVEDPTSKRKKCICDHCGMEWYVETGSAWLAAFIGGMLGP